MARNKIVATPTTEFAARRSDIRTMEAKRAIARWAVIAEDYGLISWFGHRCRSYLLA